MKHTFAISLILAAVAPLASAALSVGSLAIIGYQDNAVDLGPGLSGDLFSIATLADIPAGEVIYFTDNGWTGSQFRGASATDGDGNENLIMLTANQAIPAGTAFTNLSTSALFSWTLTGAIPGTTSGGFANPSQSTSGEQIYAFQAPAGNPLLNASTFLFVADSTNGFEPATSTSTGDIPGGLSPGNGAVSGTALGRSGTFGLNMIDPDVAALQSGGGSASQWFAVISDPTNWGTLANGALPPVAALNISLAPVPEPGVIGLLGLAGATVMRRARRRGE